MINLLNEYELVSGFLPNEPDSNQVIYVENFKNKELAKYVYDNLLEIKTTFRNRGLEFIYLPELMDGISDDQLKDEASYYIPWLKPTDLDSLRNACKIALDEIVKKVNLKRDAPAVVNNKGRAFMVDVPHQQHFNALFYQIAEAYGLEHEEKERISLFTEDDYKFYADRRYEPQPITYNVCECELPYPEEPDPASILKDEYAAATRLFEHLKEKHRGWVLEAMLAELARKDEITSRIIVNSPRKLLLPEYNNMEISMAPATMAFYLLYLKHPEGIRFKELVDHRKELYKIYSYTTKSGDKNVIARTVDTMVAQLGGSQDVHRSRIKEAINNAFKGQLYEGYASKYYLDGKRDDPMKVEVAGEAGKVVWNI